MGRHASSHAPGASRTALRKLIALLSTLALVLGLAVAGGLGTGVANAATDVPVGNLVFDSPQHSPLVVGDTVTLKGDWGPVDHPSSSDSFTVALPAIFQSTFADGYTFDLGSGPVYGSCQISNSSRLLTCTLNDSHTSETSVSGSFGLQLKAAATTNDNDANFTVNGGNVSVGLPGGKITDGTSVETGFTKSGVLQSNKYSIKWTIELGGDDIKDMLTVAIDDDLTGGTGTAQTLCTPAPAVVAQGRKTTAPDLNVDTTTATKPVFTLTAPAGGFDSNTKYVITYYTCTTSDVIDDKGKTYVNEASYTDGSGGSHTTGPKTVTQDWELAAAAKSGSFLKEGDRYGKIRWTVDIPGDSIQGTTKVVLTDTLDASQKLCESTSPYGLDVAVSERYGPNANATITGSANIAYASSSSTAFTITLNDSGTLYNFKADPYVYRVTYTTCLTTTGLPDFGADFTNSVNVNGATATGKVTMPTFSTGKKGTINDAKVTVGTHEYPANTTIGWVLTIPGEDIESTPGALTLTDTPSATQAVCTPEGLSGATSAELKTRLGLTVKAVDQVTGGGRTDVDLLADTTVSLSGSDIVFAIAPPAGHFSREYQYKVSYTLCTASGGLDAPGTTYSNSISGVSSGVSDSATLSNSAWGTGSGVTPVDSGSFALTKHVAGDAASAVSGVDFTVKVKEIPPTGTAVTYNVTVKDGQTVSGLHALGNGWTIELTEPTLPTTAAGAWGDPVFTASPGVTVSTDGKTATVTPVPGGANVAVTLTNSLHKTYAVGDYTWIDSNEDGIQDVSEAVLVGVGVELLDSSGNPAKDVYGVPVPATTTDSNGWYMFDNLPAGTYRVKFTLTPTQAGTYQFTVKDAGTDDKKDSDANSAGLTDLFTLGASNTNLVPGTDYNGNHGYLIPAGTTVNATEGIDPTWDAGVHVKHQSTGGGGGTPSTTPTSSVPTTTPGTPTTPATPTTSTVPTPNQTPVTTTVPRNECVELQEKGFEPGEKVKIVITEDDGSQYELSGTADESGTVAFCVKAERPQTLMVEVLGENRHVVRAVTVGVLDTAGGLPNTGVAVVTYLGLALLLLAGGAALMLGARRRKGVQH